MLEQIKSRNRVDLNWKAVPDSVSHYCKGIVVEALAVGCRTFLQGGNDGFDPSTRHCDQTHSEVITDISVSDLPHVQEGVALPATLERHRRELLESLLAVVEVLYSRDSRCESRLNRFKLLDMGYAVRVP